MEDVLSSCMWPKPLVIRELVHGDGAKPVTRMGVFSVLSVLNG